MLRKLSADSLLQPSQGGAGQGKLVTYSHVTCGVSACGARGLQGWGIKGGDL